MRDNIIQGAARAAFVAAWASYHEERGRTFGQCELMDIAPPTPPAARKWAEKLIDAIEYVNGEYPIETLIGFAARADGYTPDAKNGYTDPPADYAETFGHALAMQALGHGVGWTDDHTPFAVPPESGDRFRLPHAEFHMHGRGDFYSSVSLRLAREVQ